MERLAKAMGSRFLGFGYETVHCTHLGVEVCWQWHDCIWRIETGGLPERCRLPTSVPCFWILGSIERHADNLDSGQEAQVTNKSDLHTLRWCLQQRPSLLTRKSSKLDHPTFGTSAVGTSYILNDSSVGSSFDHSYTSQ